MDISAILINKFGRLAGWNSITTSMMGRDIEGIVELDYGDEVDKENVYGAGNMPIGRGVGNYKPTASITLLKEEADSLQLSAGPLRRLSDIAPFDITVSYEYMGAILKDRIRNCEFTGRSVSVKQGDKSISTKFELIVSHVMWNVI